MLCFLQIFLLTAAVSSISTHAASTNAQQNLTAAAHTHQENDEIMETANNIVFRPLFAYRKTQAQRRQFSGRRSSNNRRKYTVKKPAALRPNYYYQKAYQTSSNKYRYPNYNNYYGYPSYYQNAQFAHVA